MNNKLSNLIGTWKGTNRLHTPWMPDPLKVSDATANVRSKMNDQFISIEYTWAYEGKAEEGLLIIGCDPESNEVQTVWTDSWHSKNVLMLCNGTTDDVGDISVLGHYAVPGNPDWGWRITIRTRNDSLSCTMYNISPEGDEDLAVEMEFERG